MEELELGVWFEENACSVRMLAVFVDDFVLYGWDMDRWESKSCS